MLPTHIQALIDRDLDNIALVQQLTALARENEAALRAADGLWAVPLYTRDPFFFERFILSYISTPAVIDEVLRLSQQARHQTLFSELWRRVASRERWNDEVAHLLKTAPDLELVEWGIRSRAGQQAVAAADTLIMLYEYQSGALSKSFGNDWGSETGGLFRTTRGAARALFEFVRRRDQESDNYWALFRRSASDEEWHAALAQLIEREPAEPIGKALEKRHPHRAKDMPAALMDRLIARYGVRVLGHYLVTHIYSFQLKTVQELLAEPLDDEALRKKLASLEKQTSWSLSVTTNVWVPKLYQRNPRVFGPLLAGYVRYLEKPAALELLGRCRRDGHELLYRAMYEQVVDDETWNRDVLALAQSLMANQDLVSDLARFNNYRPLFDEPAAALYRRDPKRFGRFIRQHLRFRESPHDRKGRTYPQLQEAAERMGEHGFAEWLWRRQMTPEAWQQKMAELLAQDLPPDQIVAAMEKFKPLRPDEIDPTMLLPFLTRYGEAVLPYFERYLDWTSRPRLESLLALGLARGELLRELQAIAARQPDDFARAADVWALRLYEMGPAFFSPFLRRYLTQESEYAIRALLPRLEADGRLELFQSLYSRVIRIEEWLQEVKALALSSTGDAEVLRRLRMRDITRRGYVLSGEVALRLYQRDPQKFRSFIRRHVERHWWPGRTESQSEYDSLLDVIQARGDRELYEALVKELAYHRYWRAEVKPLLEQDLPAEVVLARLEALHPTTGLPEADTLLALFDKYGEAILPYLMKCVRWRGVGKALLARVKAQENPGLWFRVFFEMAEWGSLPRWHKALEELLLAADSEEKFASYLRLLTPPEPGRQGWSMWTVPDPIQAAMYEKYPAAARAFLLATTRDPGPALLAASFDRGDNEMFDWLTYLFIQQTAYWHWDESRSQRSYHDAEQASRNNERAALVLARLDSLFEADPQGYVRHAMAILNHFSAGEVFLGRQSVIEQPVARHLARAHPEVWRRSASAIRELLESPSFIVQRIGMTFLDSDDPVVADRVLENPRLFRAQLLSRSTRNTKRLVLRILERVAAHAPGVVLPLLEECMDFYGRRAAADEMMVILTRIRHPREAA